MATKRTLKAGETTRILRRVAHNMPQSFAFSARALTGDSVSGVVKVQGSFGPFSKPATTQPLRAENEVSKGAWDTFYSVYLTPEQDIEIVLKAAKGGKLFFWTITALLVLGTLAALLPFILR